jgi:predicted nucleotidyltransferase
MANNESKPTWPQIRDALKVNEDRLCSAWLTGSFVNPTKEVTRESDVDVVLASKTDEAIEEFALVETLGR